MSFAAAMSVGAASVEDEIKAIRAEIKSNSVTRGSVDCRYYLAYYRESCTKEERKAILERNIAAHRRWIKLAGKGGADPKGAAMPRAELGKVLEIGGRWKEAEKELAEALKYDFGKDKVAEARWALAECLWHRGDRDGAKKQVAAIAAVADSSFVGDDVWSKARFMHRAWTDPDGDLDEFKLPHSVDGKPFPTPQQAKYGEAKVSLAKVEVEFRTNGTDGTGRTGRTGGASDESRNKPRVSRVSQAPREDPIVRLLKRKLTRFGTEFAPGGTKIRIEISPDAPVAKPQGYELTVKGEERQPGQLETTTNKSCPTLSKLSCKNTNGLVSIKARDRLGATYGVVSFLQCVDRGGARDASLEPSKLSKPPKPPKPSIRTLRIKDWPKLERRGAIEAHWRAEFLELALFFKMSSVTVCMSRPECSFMFSDLERERARLTIRRYLDFGIEPYWCERCITVLPVLPFSSPRTRALHLQWFRCAAKFGGNIAFLLDDERFFGFPEEDKKAFGTAANMDSRYLTGLYREVKKDFPKFRMLFCTPFYFGPDGACVKSWYPEPREDYLKSHKDFLDPEIDVYSTGPRVKSRGFTPQNLKWFSDMIGRKQFIFYNGDGVGRHGSTPFGVDVPGFKSNNCPETLDLIAGLHMNFGHYYETSKAGACMDWCWNPEAHDAKTATRRTDDLVEGPGVFDILTEAMPSLSYFDKYQYGAPRSELLLEDAANLDKRLADAEKAWADAKAIAKNGGMFVSGFDRCGIAWAKNLVRARHNPPKWLLDKRDAEMKNTRFAVEEVGFDEKNGDQFIPSELMQGGIYNPGQGDRSGRGPRGIKYVEVGTELAMDFRCDDYPPEDPPKLIVVGMSFRETLPEMEIEVNGRGVWRGTAYRIRYFDPLEIALPVDALKRSNRLVIRNVSPLEEHWRKPLIHYVVVRKK